MTNLILDLSNLAFRSLFITGGFGSKKFTFDNQYELDQFIRKLAIDVSYIIRQTNPSRVLFALDSKSWRKNITIEENEGYKAHREKSKFINWDNVFNIIKEFGEILDSNGFIVTKIENAEADDIIALWRDELLFNQNQHIIIVSSDEDVRQLVHFFPYEVNKMAFSTVYNPFTTGKKTSKKLFISDHFEQWLNTASEGDIFNRAIDVDKEDFIRLRDNEKIIFENINGNFVALKKIFCGDDGDNVPAIFTWVNDKGKKVRITNSKFVKIIDHIGAKDYLDLEEKAKLIYDQLAEISGERPPFKIKDRLHRQIKLVVLAREVFPKEIVEEFDEQVQKQLKRPNVHPQNWSMKSVLEGTKYVKDTSNEASIFREVDKLNKELF